MIFRYIIAIVLLFSSAYAHELSFYYQWKKQQRCFELVDKETKKVHGYVKFWVVYDYQKGVKEGYITDLEVKRYARRCGLGTYLFSRAIISIDSMDVVSTTRWYAYPKRRENTDKTFLKQLDNLVLFYKHLGGIQDHRKKDLGVYLHFDHSNKKMLAQRMLSAENIPYGYILRECDCNKKCLCSAGICHKQSGKIIAEVQYQKQGCKNNVKRARFIDPRASLKTRLKTIALVSEKLHCDSEAIADKFNETEVVLEKLTDGLFISDD